MMGGPPNRGPRPLMGMNFGGGPGPQGPPPSGGGPPKMSVTDRVTDIITPCCNVPMEMQLREKKTAVERMLYDLKNEVVGANGAAENWISYHESKSRSGAFIDVKGVQSSPKTEEYRNKCDFVIGESKLMKIHRHFHVLRF